MLNEMPLKRPKPNFSSLETDEKRRLSPSGKLQFGTLNQGEKDPKKETLQSNVSKTLINKKLKVELYNKIDREWFKSDKPTNPNEFIDLTKQKVIINPGVPYVSTSQNEVFERRIMLKKKEHLNKINPFIAAPVEDKVERKYDGQMEESYISSRFDAYQLKTQYQVKQVDEIEFDSDDEDAVVLA